MSLRVRGWICAAAATLLVTGCSVLDPTNDGWVFPTPYPLPSGAVPVPIRVIEWDRPIPPDVEVATGCPLLQLDPFVIEYRPGEPMPVYYRFPGVLYQSVIWPVGVSARLNPRLEIVAVDGTVIAREGERTPSWIGGNREDGVFVCAGGGDIKRAAESPTGA